MPKSKIKDFQKPKTKRDLEMYKLKLEGWTYGALAEKYDISKDAINNSALKSAICTSLRPMSSMSSTYSAMIIVTSSTHLTYKVLFVRLF